MRWTLNIDDDLHRNLKELAQAEGTTLSDVFNRSLRLGLAIVNPLPAESVDPNTGYDE